MSEGGGLPSKSHVTVVIEGISGVVEEVKMMVMMSCGDLRFGDNAARMEIMLQDRLWGC